MRDVEAVFQPKHDPYIDEATGVEAVGGNRVALQIGQGLEGAVIPDPDIGSVAILRIAIADGDDAHRNTLCGSPRH
jgi:hypothetical protein